mmetsp:Transcript_20543/g.50665  ORF Transcript_20543/g.50665 Transcript_20543/m.50665 type:complete len:165 (-) Transcript_20543:1120-1614(-)
MYTSQIPFNIEWATLCFGRPVRRKTRAQPAHCLSTSSFTDVWSKLRLLRIQASFASVSNFFNTFRFFPAKRCAQAAGDLSRGSPETLRNLVVLRQLEDVGFKLENSADVIAELIVCFVIFQQVSRRHKFLGKKTIQGSSLIRTDNMNLPRTGGGDVEMNVREVM